MSLTIEGNPNSITNKFPLLLDTDSIHSIGVAWLFKENGSWCFLPRVTNNTSLFHNAILFFRIGFPFLLCFSLRWNGSSTAKAIFQFALGWKLNGRFAITLRVQSDVASAAGDTGPNYGQATGFDYGTH